MGWKSLLCDNKILLVLLSVVLHYAFCPVMPVFCYMIVSKENFAIENQLHKLNYDIKFKHQWKQAKHRHFLYSVHNVSNKDERTSLL